MKYCYCCCLTRMDSILPDSENSLEQTRDWETRTCQTLASVPAVSNSKASQYFVQSIVNLLLFLFIVAASDFIVSSKLASSWTAESVHGCPLIHISWASRWTYACCWMSSWYEWCICCCFCLHRPVVVVVVFLFAQSSWISNCRWCSTHFVFLPILPFIFLSICFLEGFARFWWCRMTCWRRHSDGLIIRCDYCLTSLLIAVNCMKHFWIPHFFSFLN